MKFFKQVLIFTFVICLTRLLLVISQNSAPSSHLFTQEGSRADIITGKARVIITTPSTYFSLMNFNMYHNAEMSGYTGIQEREHEYTRYRWNIFPYKEKKIEHLNIFSIWNSHITAEKILASYLGEGTKVEPFGGEGEGTKTYNVDFGWSVNHLQTIVLRRWDVPNKTRVGWFVHHGEKNEWRHMATLDYPVPNLYFEGGVSAFLEDWLSTGQNTRRFEILDYFKRNAQTKKWISLNKFFFDSKKSDRATGGRSSNYSKSFDAGINGKSVFMQIGGNTRPQSCNYVNENCDLQVNSDPSPHVQIINFNIDSITRKQIKWSVPKNQTPQFAYTIKKGNHILWREIDPQARSYTFSPPLNLSDTITLSIEDIYGNVRNVDSQVRQRFRLRKKK